MFEITGSSPLVWEQLLRLAEGGDLRAIKLYYEMLEKKERQQLSGGNDGDREIEQMASVRRAVFGDAVFNGEAVLSGGHIDHGTKTDDI